jgi:PncC family amidohydrolase
VNNLFYKKDRAINMNNDIDSDNPTQDLARQVLDVLARKNLTLASAESVTGGLASHLLTNISGCSKYYLGGVVCYTAQAKNMLLGVDWELINDYGTISPEVNDALLTGLKIIGADINFAITGVAGNPLDGKPTGTVFIGIGINGDNHVHDFFFSGSRIEIKEQAVGKAFELLLEELERF